MRYLWMALGAFLVVAPAYLAGDFFGGRQAVAKAKVRETILVGRLVAAQSERDAAQRDLSTLSEAAAQAAQDAAENGAAAARAQERIQEYEHELAKRGGADRCRLDASDERWLRDDRSGASPAGKKPPAR